MPNTHKPRSGSMQYWPRKKAKKPYARVRKWADSNEAKPLGFAGYKVGMTHVMGVDNNKEATTAGEEIPYPVTVVECPPMRIATVRLYNKKEGQLGVAKELFVGSHKHLSKKLDVPDNTQEKELDDINTEDYEDLTLLVHTQPGKTGIGKKKPEVFEVHLGGDINAKLEFAKENVGKEINVSDIFGEGSVVDVHAVTKGYGTQGPVKRFGIGLKPSKSEKGRRRPGSLGGWKGQQHFMYRVPMAGQTGYHQRTQYNNQIFKIGNDPDEINVEGGYKKYGFVKNDYILIHGSVPGPSKRMIIFTQPVRLDKKPEVPDIKYISTKSKQGR